MKFYLTQYLPYIALVAAMLTTGCRGGVTQDEPIVPIRNMHDQPRYDMQSRSEFFEDHRTMRPQVEGTVPVEAESDLAIEEGVLPDGSSYVMEVPPQVVSRFGTKEKMVDRGEQRFNIYCSPCHGRTGVGNGLVVKRGMMQPPNFHQDRVRHMPDGQLYVTIARGIRNMPAYGAQIVVDDRWAIVSYIRALQLSFQSQPKVEK